MHSGGRLAAPLMARRPVPVVSILLAAVVVAGIGACGSDASNTRAARTRAATGLGSRVLAGTIAEATFRSAALSGLVHYSVYLPPGYAGSTERYPVVYFLHGLPAGPTAYRGIRLVAAAVEASGRPAIVIGAEGARPGDRDPEWHDWGAGRNWETATAVELVSVVDHRYRTIPSRGGRALVGVSAGGYGASVIGIHHPDVFSVIESWSGYFEPTNPAGTAVLHLGSKAADTAADFLSQIPLLRSPLTERVGPTYLGFFVGTDDRRFAAQNRRADAELVADRIPNVRYGFYPGAHDWSFWGAHAADWVRYALELVAPAS